MDKFSYEEIKNTILVLWSRWNYRNQINFFSSNVSHFFLFQKNRYDVECNERQRGCDCGFESVGERGDSCSMMPSFRDWWKLNNDVLWNDSLHSEGVGWAVCDFSGIFAL